MMGVEVVRQLENRIKPLLDRGVGAIKAEFPGVSCSLVSYPVGTSTHFQGHGIAVQCLVPASGHEPDAVALEVVIRALDIQPRFAAAEVSWGDPSGVVELSLGVDGLIIDESSLDLLERGVPLLLDALRGALRRGRPLGAG